MNRLFKLILLLVLLFGVAEAQFIPQSAMAGIGPNGAYALLSVNSSGALVISGSTGTFQQVPGYVQPVAPVGYDSNNVPHTLQVDSTGALKVTSSLPQTGTPNQCLLSTSTSGTVVWGSCSGSSSTNWSNLVANTANTSGGSFQIGNGTSLAPTGTGTISANQINGTNFTGTNGDLVSFGASNIPADSGIVASNVTTQTSNGAANEVCTYTGANKVCVPGTVGNSALANSSITIAGTSVSLGGSTSSLPSPGAIGGTTPGSAAFTTLSASSTVSGSGFSTYLASPPAIGGSAPAAGNFTTLGATGNLTTNVTGGGTQCLHASNTGVVSGTGSDCGSGGGSSAFNSLTSGTNTTAAMIAGAGSSFAINFGTITTDLNPFSVTWENNNSSITYNGVVWALTDNASHSGTNVFQIKGGVAATTPLFQLDNQGDVTIPGILTANQINLVGTGSGTLTMAQGPPVASWPSNSVNFYVGTSVSTPYGILWNSTAPTSLSVAAFATAANNSAGNLSTSQSYLPVQGTDSNILSSGTVSGTGSTLCTDANGGATTTGCSGGGGGDTITSPNSTLAVGGSSSNTTLDLNGAAGEIMAGATPALTATPSLGTDNSVAGTLQLANGSANAHTLLKSVATTTNTVDFFATAPTSGHLIDCVTSGVICVLTDSGVVAANVVNASSPGAGIAHFAGSTQTVTSSAVSLTADVSGILPSANGGTGINNTATLTLGTSNRNYATLGTGFEYNTTTTGAVTDATAAQLGALIDLAQYDLILSGGTSAALVGLAPSSTSGLPLLSQGSSSNPAYAALALAALATQAADTVVMNASGSSVAPTAVSLDSLGGTNSCAGGSNALTFNSSTHAWGCNTITASGLAFPATVSGTTTSGGIPYFSNTTTLTSSGLLAANALMLGGGAGSAPVTGTLQLASNVLNNTTTTTSWTITGGGDASANSALGALTLRGANETGAGGSSSQGGGILVAGGSNAATNAASVGGTLELLSGPSTGSSNTGLNGLFLEVETYPITGTVTQWNLECFTASTGNAVSDCSSATSTNFAGVALSKNGSVSVNVAVGDSIVPTNVSASPATVGHTICMNSSGAASDSGGGNPCTSGITIGTAYATSGTWPAFPDGTAFPSLTSSLALVRLHTAPTATSINGQNCIPGQSCNVNAGNAAGSMALNEGNGNQLGSFAMTTLGDMIYGGASGVFTRLAGGTTVASVPMVLTETPTSGPAAAAPVWSLSGVPIDATSPATLLATDRANYLKWGSGTALALPSIASTGFGSNLPFSIQNVEGATLTITPNAGHSDLIDGSATGTILNNFAAFVYQDSATNWDTIKFPTFAAFGSTCTGVLQWSTTTGFSCNASPTLTAPNIGAATGTSLLVTGILDGTAPVTITTGTSATLGAGTYQSGYTFNQEGTAGTGVTYTLPATVKGAQYCVHNSGTTSVVNIGVLTVYPASGSYVILNGVVNTVGGGGTHGVASGGAAGDGACFVAIDSTHWEVFPLKGTWTAN